MYASLNLYSIRFVSLSAQISSKALDYDTITGSDRFGNIYVSRLPEDVSDRVDDDPSSGAADVPLLNGCPFKLEKIVQVHIGDVAAGITVASLQSEGTESIIYGTLMGKTDTDIHTYTYTHTRNEDLYSDNNRGWRLVHSILPIALFFLAQVESAPSSPSLLAKRWT